MSAPLIVGAILVLLAIVIIARTVNIVQQGYVGMVKRVGEFHSVRQPGLTFLVPLVDSMVLVDIRETPELATSRRHHARQRHRQRQRHHLSARSSIPSWPSSASAITSSPSTSSRARRCAPSSAG